ncbi:MAG: type II toxin-antitoxin system HicA family toxin [Nitrococcus mobilis]|nr:type II toxin-antitoxin system HicA family toxin [Nitrococcus mobilis]
MRDGSDANVAFADLCQLLGRFGFSEHTRSSHHVFSREGIEERFNLQESGAKAKPYQVQQVRAIIARYHLEVSE